MGGLSARDEKTLRMYEQLARIAMHDDRNLTERANLFLLANSFLFAGFVLLLINIVYPLNYIVAVVGLTLSIVYICVSRATLTSVLFLWQCLCSRSNRMPQYLRIGELKS